MLNIDRVYGRRGFVAVKAIMGALSSDIPEDFWKGVTHTPEEAEYHAGNFEARKRMQQPRGAR